jgi:hypothetical protein
MGTQSITMSLPPACNVNVPEPDHKIHDVIPRWSDNELSLPYAVVTPTSISDINATIRFAAQNSLKVIPAVGGHASFLSVGLNAIYLNLTSPEFKKIELDQEKDEVTIGGGVLTGELIDYLAGKGWYTTTPNSDAVGMVGALLGGLSCAVNGLHGFGIDHIKAIDIVPFFIPSSELEVSDNRDKVVTLAPSSKVERKRLFNVLCGAGHGLGIITSVTLSAFRLNSLKMTDNKIWTRRLIFPTSCIAVAAALYVSLLPPPPALAPVLVFMRAPPTAPIPGAPIVMLALSYFGPKEEAEEICKSSYEEKYTGKAVVVDGAAEWGNMNISSAPLNAHGGFKESYAAFCKEVDTEAVERAFGYWEKYSNGQGRGRSYTVFSAWDTAQLLRNGEEEAKRGFFSARDRGVFVQCTPWYYDSSGKADADRIGKEVVDAIREKDRREGRADWAFANNLVVGNDLREVYSGEQIEEIKMVREIWDKENLGWAPVDGW